MLWLLGIYQRCKSLGSRWQMMHHWLADPSTTRDSTTCVRLPSTMGLIGDLVELLLELGAGTKGNDAGDRHVALRSIAG